LTEANAGAPLDLRLLESASAEIDGYRSALRPARLVVIVRYYELQFEVRNGVISTSGRFDDWRPADLFLRRQVNMIPRGPRESLVLRGGWRVRAGDVIDGELERRARERRSVCHCRQRNADGSHRAETPTPPCARTVSRPTE